MANENMYELAFRYKSTKLWQQVFDDELFGVQMPDGEVGYCSIMGELGDHIALGLYVGDKGYQSYRLLLDHAQNVNDDMMTGFLLTSQDCLQCSFENKDMLSEGELEEVRAYAGAHDMKLRGKNAFPQFTKYRPGRYPWHFDSELDEQRICTALSAACALKKMLRGHQKYELGINPLRENPAKIPLLTRDGERWIIKFTPLPSAKTEYPVAEFTDEVMAARIRKQKKRGTLYCGLTRLPNPVQSEDAQDEAPYFPLAFVSMNPASGMLLTPIVTDGEDAAEIVNRFAGMFLSAKVTPERICVRDEQSEALLSNLCRKTGIRLSLEEHLEELEDTMSQMLYSMGAEAAGDDAMGGVEDLCETLMRMRDGELKQMPEEMVDMLLDLAEHGMIPDAFAKRLRKLFR